MELIKTEKYNHTWTSRKDKWDMGIVNEVYTAPVYDFSKVKFEYPIEYILDIGGHIGGFAVRCAQLYPSALIKTFEPIPDNYSLLKMNVEAFKNIQAFNFAVAGDLVPVELETLYYGPDGVNTGGSNYKYGKGESCTKSIHIMALMASKKPIDILKIDCEGGEEAIIPHLDFEKIRGCIMIEFHNKLYGKPKEEELIKIITDNGFKSIFLDNHYYFCPMHIFVRS